MLRSRIAHLVRTAAPLHTPVHVDVILISHAHADHFDPASLRRLPRQAKVVVPAGLGRRVARLGFDDVREVVAGDVLELADVAVRVIEAVHAPGRMLGLGGALPVGYLIGDEPATFFAGDTDLHDGLLDLRGHVGLALLPISGWGPRVPAGHLDPVRAARALRLVRPRLCVPVHWGTFRPFYRRRAYDRDVEAPDRFRLLAEALAPDVEVKVLRPGESWSFRTG